MVLERHNIIHTFYVFIFTFLALVCLRYLNKIICFLLFFILDINWPDVVEVRAVKTKWVFFFIFWVLVFSRKSFKKGHLNLWLLLFDLIEDMVKAFKNKNLELLIDLLLSNHNISQLRYLFLPEKVLTPQIIIINNNVMHVSLIKIIIVYALNFKEINCLLFCYYLHVYKF